MNSFSVFSNTIRSSENGFDINSMPDTGSGAPFHWCEYLSWIALTAISRFLHPYPTQPEIHPPDRTSNETSSVLVGFFPWKHPNPGNSAKDPGFPENSLEKP
jgi:hypothetical protein